ncbi:MAG TPA: helix-turn-helix domain-containing protein [Candidatus Acidoferrum sp.]|jgi:AcrR family transcriptional regulator
MRKRPNLLAGENVPSAPRQKRSWDKRIRLMAAGIALFGEKGYAGTSIDEIAQRARLAVGSFYQHFRSKRQLLLALMDELLQKLSALKFEAKELTDARVGMRELLRQAFSHDLRYVGAYRAWQEAAFADRNLARKQKAIHEWTTSRVMTVFQVLQRLPGARRGVDVRAVARVMDAFFWSLLAEAESFSESELKERIEAAADLIYHALFRDSAER